MKNTEKRFLGKKILLVPIFKAQTCQIQGQILQIRSLFKV